LDQDAEICARALKAGSLEIAEKRCRQALGEPGNNILAPQLKSQRLFTLATIRRQQAAYTEAAELLRHSMALELDLSGDDSPQLAARRLEMSLILAGQGQWREGAQLLEQLVTETAQLNKKDQAVLANAVHGYAVQLQKIDADKQASRLLAALTGFSRSAQGNTPPNIN
jgi:hypothetical protein